MRKLTCLLTVVVMFSFIGCAKIYTAPDFDSYYQAHKVMAILPFKISYDESKLPKEMTAEMLAKAKEEESYAFQDQLYIQFLDRQAKKNQFTVDFQDVSQTNILLNEAGMKFDSLPLFTKKQIKDVLGVDALLSGTMRKEKPMSAACYVQAMDTKNTTFYTIILTLFLNVAFCQTMNNLDKRNQAESFLKGQIEKDKTPCVHYAIFTRDSIIYKFQSGLANIEKQIQVSESTTFNAYSVTKTFTALAVLQLSEQGKLDLDKPVKNYLTDFPYPSDITVRQLLTHSAGIPNPIPLSWIHLTDEHTRFERNLFFKNIFEKNNTTKANPNEKFNYSNLGYVLLGQLIEAVSGLSYEQYIKDNILKMIGIKTNELDFFITDTDNHAKGYHKKLSFSNAILGLLINKSKYMDRTVGKWKSFKNLYVNGSSYGGLIGTSSGFVKYIQGLLQTDSKLISADSKQELFKENYTTNNKPTGMCLAWFKGELNGKKYFSHAGGGGGYYCEIRIYPCLGIGSVIMFNRTGMTDERILNKVDKFFIGENQPAHNSG